MSIDDLRGKGHIILKGENITFTVTNDKSPDKILDGAKTDNYAGKITDENKLFLDVKLDSGELKVF